MGVMRNGEWFDEWYDTAHADGAFVRPPTQFRNWVTPDGSPGPSGTGGFRAEPDRYHLYVSLACPWAHRTLIFRRLKGLEAIIPISVVHYEMGREGWSFFEGEGVIADPIFSATYLREIYVKAASDYTGRVTVPVLWDKETHTIVSNESSEIIRMFNSAFDSVGANDADFSPPDLLDEIERTNKVVYDNVNNGVYRAGFATTQSAYADAFQALFATLDDLDRRISQTRYLAGDSVTEADWRLFTTLVRFDAVYHGHFKCNLRRITDYPNLWAWVRELYQWPGVAETVNFDHIKNHYYLSHRSINPSGIVPLGPAIDFDAPHGRDRQS